MKSTRMDGFSGAGRPSWVITDGVTRMLLLQELFRRTRRMWIRGLVMGISWGAGVLSRVHSVGA
jgi:hypothetical protein